MEGDLLVDYEADVIDPIASLAQQSQALLTIKQFCTAFPWPSESAMRSYVYRAKDLGLDRAFVKFKKRVLVKPNVFFTLIQRPECYSKKGGNYGSTLQPKGKTNS